tara:strand:- start:417 stop:776 length:360 start_codon:yes stop_codon:yes gene_type:complete
MRLRTSKGEPTETYKECKDIAEPVVQELVDIILAKNVSAEECIGLLITMVISSCTALYNRNRYRKKDRRNVRIQEAIKWLNMTIEEATECADIEQKILEKKKEYLKFLTGEGLWDTEVK